MNSVPLDPQQQTAVEEWRGIKDFPWYEVSNMGHVRKIKHTCSHDTSSLFKNLTGTLRKGYRAIEFKVLGHAVWKSIHVLVLENFVGQRPEGYVAHHKDTDILNNKDANLEWVTYYENVHQAYIAGNLNQKGSKNNGSILKEKEVLAIKKLLSEKKLLHHEIGAMFGVARSTISQINNGLNWSHLEVPNGT